jgi:hypothetical protein
MFSFRKDKEEIQAALTARHMGATADPAASEQQSVVARWPRRKLRQLRRRYEAAHREEPDTYLTDKWERLRPT